MLRPTPTAVSGQLQPDPPQWLGGRFRAQQDRHRHDQGLPGRQWRPGRGFGRVRELVESLTRQVVNALVRNRPGGGTFHIEDVQDQVELALMRSGEHDVALRAVPRSAPGTRGGRRADAQQQAAAPAAGPSLNVTDNGVRRPLDIAGLRATIEAAGVGLTEFIDTEAILKETVKICTTASPWTKCSSPPSCPPARWSRKTRPTARSPPACCCTRSARKCWARKSRRPT